MRGFRFRLDSVRRIRSSELDARQAELERARQRLGADREAAVAAGERVRVADGALVRTLSAGIGGEGLRSALEARVVLGRASTNANQAAEESATAEQAALSDVTKAWRRNRSLETLRARALTLWRGEQSQREQREDDERAVQTWRVLPVLIAGLLLLAAPSVARADEPASGSVPVAGELAEETLRRILGELRLREQALERRESDVAQRERVADELAVDAKRLLVELDVVRAVIDQRVGDSDAEAAKRIDRLAKTYAEMEPAQAAPLLEALEFELATAIVSKMKSKDSAAVLAQMSKKRALQMSELAANPLGERPTRSTQ